MIGYSARGVNVGEMTGQSVILPSLSIVLALVLPSLEPEGSFGEP
jgi:hypothetical protein